MIRQEIVPARILLATKKNLTIYVHVIILKSCYRASGYRCHDISRGRKRGWGPHIVVVLALDDTGIRATPGFDWG